MISLLSVPSSPYAKPQRKNRMDTCSSAHCLDQEQTGLTKKYRPPSFPRRQLGQRLGPVHIDEIEEVLRRFLSRINTLLSSPGTNHSSVSRKFPAQIGHGSLRIHGGRRRDFGSG